MRRLAIWVSALMMSQLSFAGGPLYVGGPALGINGVPITWANGAVNYRTDGGNFAGTKLANATGVTRVQSMFSTWTSVPTASLSATKIGTIQPVGVFADGDVSTAAEFDAVTGDCQNGHQSPVIFDATGAIFEALIGDPGVIGIAGPCASDSSGHITAGFAMLNGKFQDGVSNQSNFEISSDFFDEAITHELGHLLGLDHSQINVEMKNAFGNCDASTLAGLPIMFPFLTCQTRVSAGLPKLSPDDIAWISKLYPGSSFNSTYGIISGQIYFSDGISGAQGVNVIARDVNNPQGKAFSVVSGFLFTGNVGQSVSGDNSGGSEFGTREASKVGYFEIPVLAGTYTLEVESIDPEFEAGSSVGPLRLPVSNPGANEFWDDVESSFDDENASTPIVVGAGSSMTGKNIILNGTAPTFDDYEEE